MKVTDLNKLIEYQIQDLYSAENRLIKALPKMVKASHSPSLGSGFETHLEQTKEHVKRLEDVANELDISPKGEECAGMKGLVEEGDHVIKELEPGYLADVALISAAQRVEHYEIAAYTSLIALLECVGYDDEAGMLEETLNEEEETSEELSTVQESILNDSLPAKSAGALPVDQTEEEEEDE